MIIKNKATVVYQIECPQLSSIKQTGQSVP